MSLFLIGVLIFLGGLGGLALTGFLAYFFTANVMRSAVAAGTVSAGSLAAQIPEKKKVVSYLFKQVFYWKSWVGRVASVRLVASNARGMVREIGVRRASWRGVRYVSVVGWGAFRRFLKALVLPYAIAGGLSVVAMFVGGLCMLIAFGIWVFG